MAETSVAIIEGPRGQASVVADLDRSGETIDYRVLFHGRTESFERVFRAVDEALVVAREKAGLRGTSIPVALLEGCHGRAEIFELMPVRGGQPEYEVMFSGATESFSAFYKSMGEAYRMAQAKAGAR